jgi:5'-nucleotidase
VALNNIINPYYIFNQYQLAVIGVTSVAVPTTSTPGPGTTFSDPIEIMQATINQIYKTTNVTRIIAMTHVGYDVDREMAQKTKGLYLIVGGRSHTLLGDFEGADGPYPTIETNLDGEDVLIVTA